MKDMYLELAQNLYESGAWDKETVRRKLIIYSKFKNDSEVSDYVSDFIKNLDHEYTIEEKRAFLSVVTMGDDSIGTELKYGDAVNSMNDELVSEIYEHEIATLTKSKVEEMHKMASSVQDKSSEEVVENEVVEPTKPEVPVDWYKPLEETNKGPDLDWYKPLEEVANAEPVVESKPEEEISLVEVIPAIEPVVEVPIINQASSEVSNNNVEILEPEVKNEEPVVSESIQNNGPVVIGDIFNVSGLQADAPSFDGPATEEEYQQVANNLNSIETDSSVRQVNAPIERINKLKKNKGRVINYFLKGAIVVSLFTLTSLGTAIPIVAGYLILANQIESGKFKPKNKFESAIKSTAEKIIYMGMSNREIMERKEEFEEERGKTR